MRFRKRRLVLASVVGAVLAVALTLVVHRDVVDVVLMIVIGVALVGMYLLRGYARTELLYAPPPIMTRTQADRRYRNDSRARGPATSPDDAAPEPRTA